MGTALRILGYRVHKGFRFNIPGKVQIAEPITRSGLASVALPIARSYTAFEDNPWCLLYRELDAAFPGSKFILTRRYSEDWVDSLMGHFDDELNPTFRYIYGCENALVRPRQHYIDIYEHHNETVLNYFKDRPNDLLVFDLERADWEPICTFLDQRQPRFRRYPHRNSAASRMGARLSLENPTEETRCPRHD